MTKPLFDGTVLPNNLIPGRARAHGIFAVSESVRLLIGEVYKAIPPDSADNLLKDRWEYLVNVAEKTPSGIFPQPYRATVFDGFGGMGDHLRYTVREADPLEEGELWGTGTRVLILCINGDTTQALIIGGARHEKLEAPDPSETFLDFAFNGVHAAIDKDGALVVEVPGATKTDGTKDNNRDENNKGSKVSFDADGTITISDENGESIRFSPKDKIVEVLSEEVSVHAKAAVTIYAEGDALVRADGEARVEGSTIRLGSAEAQENLVLGQKLMDAMAEFVDIFANGDFIGQATGPTNPVLPHPTFVTKINAWKASYATSASPLLSADKYTE